MSPTLSVSPHLCLPVVCVVVCVVCIIVCIVVICVVVCVVCVAVYFSFNSLYSFFSCSILTSTPLSFSLPHTDFVAGVITARGPMASLPQRERM